MEKLSVTKFRFAALAAILVFAAVILTGCAATNVYGGPTTILQGADDGQPISELEKQMEEATALLYAWKDGGEMQMFCTATAFERSGKTYRFVSAAHCVAEDYRNKVEVVPFKWFISFDEPGVKKFHPAKLLGVGFQSRGDDFAVLEVTLDREIPLIPMATKDAVLGEKVSNVASPLGLGKQLFRGHVSKTYLDRPVGGRGFNWTGATLLQIKCGPGSSGSSVVSRKNKAIVSILVGIIYRGPSVFIVSIPATKFNRFWKDVQNNKYPWYKPSDNGSFSNQGAKRDLTKFMERIERGISVNLDE